MFSDTKGCNLGGEAKHWDAVSRRKVFVFPILSVLFAEYPKIQLNPEHNDYRWVLLKYVLKMTPSQGGYIKTI